MVTTLPGLLLRTMAVAVGLTQSGSVFKSLAHVAARVHVNAHNLSHTLWPCWCPRVVITASAREIWVPSAVRGVMVSSRPRLQLRTISGSVALLNLVFVDVCSL